MREQVASKRARRYGKIGRSNTLTDRPPPSSPNQEREIPYLICKECNTPCYVFEVEAGHVTEAMCLACGNEAVVMFTIAEWEDENA
jgi:hypothetical protein